MIDGNYMRLRAGSRLRLVAASGGRAQRRSGAVCQQHRRYSGVECVDETTVGPGRTEANCCRLVGALYRWRYRTSERTFYDWRVWDVDYDVFALWGLRTAVADSRRTAHRGYDCSKEPGGRDCDWLTTIVHLLAVTSLSLDRFTNYQSTWTHEATPCTRTGYRYEVAHQFLLHPFCSV